LFLEGKQLAEHVGIGEVNVREGVSIFSPISPLVLFYMSIFRMVFFGEQGIVFVMVFFENRKVLPLEQPLKKNL
jgi:hypothetical protein